MNIRDFECVADTSAIITWLRRDGDPQSFHPRCVIPLIALAELCVGLLRSARPGQQADRLNPWLAWGGFLEPNQETCQIYAGLATELEKIGQPIPSNDLWIAALALQWNLPVATTDAHFERVPGLRLIRV